MATTPKQKDVEETESLKFIIDEQKRNYDYLLHIYNRIRATEYILLTAAFGAIAYLYYPAANNIEVDVTDIAQRFFFPSESYGQVIYFMAAAFFLYGVVKLTLNVFGNNPWQTTYESVKKDYTYKPIDTLIYIKSRYDECQKANGDVYSKRRKELTFLFFCIVISAIILIVIKTLR